MILTEYQGAILGPIAKILGQLMEWIFNGLDIIGIPNVGLSIILFTLIIYLCLMPLTIKQQKFSKLSAKMNPELQAIQAKYKGKKDNDSMMRMNEETKAVYEKYGTSPTGSCLQLIIQMPILFALYRVIDNIPAYVDKVKTAFLPLASNIADMISKNATLTNDKSVTVFDFINGFVGAPRYAKQDFTLTNTIIDVLNKSTTAEFNSIKESIPSLAANVDQTVSTLDRYNIFLGLNISNTPSYYVIDCFKNHGSVLLMIGGIMVPVLAALTQWINTKLMPQPESSGNDEQNSVAASMKTMNVMMPIMSAVFCFTLPAGMGLYWIAGAVIRSIQQIVINKVIDKEDIDEVIKKNMEKAKKKREKQGVSSQTVTNSAKISTKAISNNKSKEQIDSSKYYNTNAKEGSLTAKANMVKKYNEKNN